MGFVGGLPANSPLLFADINGDSIDLGGLSEEQQKQFNSQIALLMFSKTFLTYYNILLKSSAVYRISAQRGEEGTSSEVGQFFDPKTKEVGIGEKMELYAMAQEFFHAYQDDGKFYQDDEPKPLSTIETEGDILTLYVLSEAAIGTPMNDNWDSYFVLDSYGGLPSLEKFQSADYQREFQKAVDNRIAYYKSTGLDVPTYIFPNTGSKPKAIEALIKLIKQ